MSGQNGNEERDSQLSAMFDGELSNGECDLTARRLGRDPGLRVKWGRYALVGAVVRGDREVVVKSGFCERVAGAIGREPTYGEAAGGSSPRATPLTARPALGWRRPLAGAAVAAGVAALSILYLRTEGSGFSASSVVASSPASGPVAVVAPSGQSLDESGGEAASYVVPAPSRNRAFAMPTAQLANYVVAHSEFSSPLGRRNLLSALMAGESLGPAPGSGTGPGGGSAIIDAPSADNGVVDGSSLQDPSGAAGNASR